MSSSKSLSGVPCGRPTRLGPCGEACLCCACEDAVDKAVDAFVDHRGESRVEALRRWRAERPDLAQAIDLMLHDSEGRYPKGE